VIGKSGYVIAIAHGSSWHFASLAAAHRNVGCWANNGLQAGIAQASGVTTTMSLNVNRRGDSIEKSAGWRCLRVQ